eukprot:2619957-Rhodomonas_salina.2
MCAFPASLFRAPFALKVVCAAELTTAAEQIWEYKKVKVGPFTYTKKVPKASVESQLKEERGAMMAELDPEAFKVPEEQPPPKEEGEEGEEGEENELEEKDVQPAKTTEELIAQLTAPEKDSLSPEKKKPSGLVSRFTK